MYVCTRHSTLMNATKVHVSCCCWCITVTESNACIDMATPVSEHSLETTARYALHFAVIIGSSACTIHVSYFGYLNTLRICTEAQCHRYAYNITLSVLSIVLKQ